MRDSLCLIKKKYFFCYVERTPKRTKIAHEDPVKTERTERHVYSCKRNMLGYIKKQ